MTDLKMEPITIPRKWHFRIEVLDDGSFRVAPLGSHFVSSGPLQSVVSAGVLTLTEGQGLDGEGGE